MRLSTFSPCKFISVGVLLILGGCLSIALGISSATPLNASYPFGQLGYGIWAGVFFFLTGIINIVAGCKTTPDLIVWCLVMNIITCILAALEIALGITAANQDYTAQKFRNMEDTANPSLNDQLLLAETGAYLQSFFPMTYLVAKSRNLVPTIYNGVIVVDALLAFAGFFVIIVASAGAASSCKYVCCPNLMTDLDAVTVISTVPHHHEGRNKANNEIMYDNAGFQEVQ